MFNPEKTIQILEDKDKYIKELTTQIKTMRLELFAIIKCSENNTAKITDMSLSSISDKDIIHRRYDHLTQTYYLTYHQI